MVLTVPLDWHHVSVSNGTRRDNCGEPINLPFAPYGTSLQKYQAKSFGWVKEVSLLLGTSQSIQKTPSFDFCSQQLVAFKNLHLKPSLKIMFQRQSIFWCVKYFSHERESNNIYLWSCFALREEQGKNWSDWHTHFGKETLLVFRFTCI